MDAPFRHQCLIYDGSPAKVLPALTATIREKLSENYRCLYLNSPPMVAGIRAHLSAAGVDVPREIAGGRLVLSSARDYLRDGEFAIDRMLATLEDTLSQALGDGYRGVWASGDVAWELGPEQDFSMLLDYELRLERFMQSHPSFCGICQYHATTLPQLALREGLVTHPVLFANATLSRLNPHYIPLRRDTRPAATPAELDAAVRRICRDGLHPE